MKRNFMTPLVYITYILLSFIHHYNYINNGYDGYALIILIGFLLIIAITKFETSLIIVFAFCFQSQTYALNSGLMFEGILILFLFTKYFFGHGLKSKYSTSMLLGVIIFLMIDTVHFFNSDKFSFLNLLRFDLTILLLFLGIYNQQLKISRENQATLIDFTTITVVIVGLMGILAGVNEYGTGYISTYLFSGTYRLGEAYREVGGSDGLGFSCAIALSLITTKFSFGKNGEGKFKYIIYFTLICLLGLLTKTRAFLICLLLVLIIYIVYRLVKYKHAGKLNLLDIGLICVIILCGINEQFLNFVSNGFSRFEDVSNFNELSNGRIGIYLDIVKIWTDNAKNFLFGVGINNYQTQLGILAHNITLEAIVSWGLIGTLDFIVLICFAAKFRGRCKQGVVNFLPFLMLLIVSQTIETLSNPRYYIFILVLFVYIYSTSNKNVRSQN
ncbi:hypothetical protein [Fictibacillus sp. NRS-1165]|uniref:hypothetical protein n=1 Tax=Fictibacillus sp. NRS-1165 TaxID=3144463 RepID=UPI003D259517